MPSSKPLKVKPSEVAADTKKKLIPEVFREYQHMWPTQSLLYSQPLLQLPLVRANYIGPGLPEFAVRSEDPVNLAIDWAQNLGGRIPFICAANEKRAGGDWETGVVGYEERLCRRSNLSATLDNPASGSNNTNYPIPIEGAIYSPYVVRFRRSQDQMESLGVKDWNSLPVVSMPPARWPKLTDGGNKYSFSEERQLVRNKIRAALRICAFHGYHYVVIGDFGLGNGFRNPPRELAELWREVLLWDADLRGQFASVAFVFEDEKQSTTKYILEDMAKKSKTSSSKSRSKNGSAPASSSSSHVPSQKSDFKIFSEVFDGAEIARVRNETDPRYDFSTIMGSGV